MLGWWFAVSNVTLRPCTREEYHEFFQGYEPDPVMDPKPYHYQRTHVDHCFDYDMLRKEWYPTFGIFENDRIVGTLSLKRIDSAASKCEIGLVLQNDSCKNRGIGTRAMQLGMEIAVEQYSITNIWADTMGHNKRMQHILEKLGFQLKEHICGVYDMPSGKEDRLVYCWIKHS